MMQINSITTLLVSAIVAMSSVVCAEIDTPKVYNIVTYGAVGDGVTLNSEAIQKTIDA